ncbi:MAG: phage integrase N-terminal SAM-like domain-containing protein [Dokdonella sp.]|nr:phage integrase N-terminal SAM-like domain-containing protein [Dokdonella sp.]
MFDEIRRILRLKRYSLYTERAYTGWIRRFILASGRRHPRELGAAELEAFLSGLAVQGRVAAST